MEFAAIAKKKRKTMNKKVLFILCVFSLFLFGCKKTDKEIKEINQDDGKLKIVATLFPDYSFAKAIATDADTTLLLPPGVDSHTFEPGPDDMKLLKEADLIIYTGDYMEEWFKKIRESLSLDDSKIVDASKGIELIKSGQDDHDNHDEEDHDEHEHHHHHLYDPHIWTSPKLAKIMCKNIYDGLISVDKENESKYKENFDAYTKELDNIDEAFTEVVKESKDATMYFSSPFALKYFARDYNINARSIYQTCASDSEPSAKDMALIIDDMKEKNAKVIYYEELTDPKMAREIVNETGAEPVLFHSCHNLSRDDFKKGLTYIEIMKNNVEALRKGIL